MLAFALLLAAVTEASAANRHPDISVGAALPSLGAAVYENPAGLPGGSGRELDLGINASAFSDLQVYGSFATGKGSFGAGVSVERGYMGALNAAAGVGVKLGKFSLGLNASSPILSPSPRFGAGATLEIGKGRLGLYVPSLTSPTQAWVLGFATGGSTLTFGLDARFSAPVGGIAPNGAVLTPALELSIGRSLAVALSYSLTVLPTFSSRGFGAGAQYWVGKSWAIFALYNMGLYPLTLGVNIGL